MEDNFKYVFLVWILYGIVEYVNQQFVEFVQWVGFVWVFCLLGEGFYGQMVLFCYGDENVVFVFEMLIDCVSGDVCFFGDVVQGGMGYVFFMKYVFGGINDLFVGFEGFCFGVFDYWLFL